MDKRGQILHIVELDFQHSVTMIYGMHGCIHIKTLSIPPKNFLSIFKNVQLNIPVYVYVCFFVFPECLSIYSENSYYEVLNVTSDLFQSA